MSENNQMTPEEMQRIAEELRQRIREKFSSALGQQMPSKDTQARAESDESDDGIFDS